MIVGGVFTGVSCVVFVTAAGLVIVSYITGALWEAEQKKEMIRYLRSVQCPDGGWGLLVDYMFTDHDFRCSLFVLCRKHMMKYNYF